MTKCNYKVKIYKHDAISSRNTNMVMSKLAVEAACLACSEDVLKVEIIENKTGAVKAVFYH